MVKQNETWLRGRSKFLIHILIWGIVFALPLVFMQREGVMQWKDFIRFLPLNISFLIAFYVNYSYLVDKLFFKRKITNLVVNNILLIVGMALLLHFWHQIEFIINPPPAAMPPKLHKAAIFFFILRDAFSLTFVSVLGVLMRATERINQMQLRQKELEGEMVDAELKNLKNQISPHFLLNTLNNIYALASINSPKTSVSIMELSELLRYMLYENDKTFVPLSHEANFITNYIDLMKLRLTDNIQVTTKIDISDDSNIKIAPYIYISLIENAFKHGVSNDEPSFVDIELVEKENGQVRFLCRNSFFPKDKSDCSGSGVGLQQVEKRLEMLYPYRYIWHKELIDNEYSVVLIINTLEIKSEDKNENEFDA